MLPVNKDVNMASRMATELRQLSKSRALSHNLKLLNLSNVKRINFRFNPFQEKVSSIREMLYELSSPKLRQSNISCMMKTDVRSDRCQPEMEVLFGNGHKAIFRTENLDAVDIAKEFNKLCKVNDIQQPKSTASVGTKSMNKSKK